MMYEPVSRLEFTVVGDPVPQGSKNAWVNSRGPKPRAVIHDVNAKTLKPWRALVAAEAGLAASGLRIDGPVVVDAVFVIRRPASVKRTHPSVKPDLDKLARALLDGITDAGLVWKDDAQVVRMHVEKRYAEPGEAPGVHVRVGEL